MRALITGGNGFIGSNLARRLLREGHDVAIVLHHNGDPWRVGDIAQRVSVYTGDLSDQEFVVQSMRSANPDCIFHCAAYGAYSGERDPERMEAVNVKGLNNLLTGSASVGCETLINVASCFEYEDSFQPLSETDEVTSGHPYGLSRLVGTRLCSAYSQENELNAITFRLFSTYGPYEDPRRLIAQLCLTKATGKWPEVNPPFVVRDYTHVDDVIDALLLGMSGAASHERGAVYNLGSGAPCSVPDLVDNVAKLLQLDPPKLDESPESASLPIWVSDSSLLRETLGWTPNVDLAAGLSETVQWMESNAEIYSEKAPRML